MAVTLLTLRGRLSWLGALGAWARLAHGGDMTETFIAKPQCHTLSLSVFSWASQRSQGGFSRLCWNSGSQVEETWGL